MTYFHAYYYGFEATGVPAIDRILEAVARSGKLYHHTDMWSDSDPYFLGGVSCEQLIQNAANAAAAEWIQR